MMSSDVESMPPELAEDPTRSDPRYDCLVISDLHLGSDVCQARLLEEFLEWAVTRTSTLVINGDIFDDLNFKRLTKRHFAVLKVIRRNTDRDDLRVIWIRGNHDGPGEIVSHIVGVDIHDEYIHDNGAIRLLIFHGDQFDHFITRYKWITSAACKMFYAIQRYFPHNASRWIRRVSKKFQRNSQLVMRTAIDYARQKGCRFVTCGHTHLELETEQDGVRYFNTGTWTDHPPCPYLAIRGPSIGLEHWPHPRVPATATAPPNAAATAATVAGTGAEGLG
jgi:UDP-2,3-diacylglucosamine pyrophosphatase LpxH